MAGFSRFDPPARARAAGYNGRVRPSADPIRPADRRRRVLAVVLVAAAISAAVAILHGPSTRLALTGDSYQWVQHAHAAAHRSELLLADLDTFLRPSTTWTLVADRALWGGFNASGYRISSLMIHGLAALALAIAGRRLGLSWWAAGAVALLWATSPFTDESAFVVAYRFQPLLLLSWLALVALWPRAGERWSGGRVALAAVAVLAAAAAKETWVVTPALVAALEIDGGRSPRRALRPALAVGAAVLVYVAAYFAAFPGSKSYYQLGEHLVAKIPTQLAAFLYLDEARPFVLELGWRSVVATLAVAAVAIACLRWRLAGTWTALALLLVPTLPTLAVPFMPQRYLAIPYAGFLLLIAVWLGGVGARLPRWRRAVPVVVAVVAVVVAVAGGAVVRADLADYRRMAAAHEALLAEAAAVAQVVAVGAPVAVVRDERAQPLLDILRAPQGLAKLPYTRHADPYGLIDAAALFEWVLAEEETRVEHVAEWQRRCAGAKGAVLVHLEGGFIDGGAVGDLGAEVARWQAEGRRLRVVQAVPLTRTRTR